VYSRIAVFYYCPESVHELTFANAILGHYWIDEKGVVQRDYSATLFYEDYRVSDAAVFKYQGKRCGIQQGEPGVEILEIFKQKPAVASGKSRKEKKQVGILSMDDTKDHTILRVNPPTRSRVGQVHSDLGSRTWDETVSALVDEHYVLQQITSLLSPLYEQLTADSPFGALQALLGDGGAYMVDEKLSEHYQTSLLEVVSLLEIASVDAGDERTPAAYLRELVEGKRTFKKSYEKRHKDKDYSKLSTSKLRGTKMPGAAEERFKRAVNTIMKHNETVTIPEFRRFVSPALVVDLVGGRPSEAKAYIESRPDVDEHHAKYGIKPGINRIPLVSVKLEVPEWPEGVEPTESSAEVEEEEETTGE
jgi:hypothetical protein